jgi:hypothetical protein
MTNQRWTIELIRSGIELFISTHSRMPTARDFDAVDYLPTARQIQRNFGGLPGLREELGYGKLDFTKGELRKKISRQVSSDGILAEEYLEPLLITKFGEPFVHTQKRYAKGSKHRYDFFIYARQYSFGVDVFHTGRPDYIGNNVRHKIEKYRQALEVPTIFVVIGNELDEEIIQNATRSVPALQQLPHIRLMNEAQFLGYIETLSALELPLNFLPIV